MTTFVNKSSSKIANKTIFTNIVNVDGRVRETNMKPEAYKVVELIGIDSIYGAVFKAYDHDSDDFILFFGIAGDEFNS